MTTLFPIPGFEALPLTARARRLRQDCLERVGLDDHSPSGAACPDTPLLRAESYRRTEGQPPALRRAQAVAHILRGVPVEIGAEEVIVGRYPYRHLSAEEQAALQAAQQYLSTQPPVHGSDHLALDNDKLLSVSVAGILAEIAQRKAAVMVGSTTPSQQAEAERRREFYDAARIVLEGLLDFAERHAAEAERLAENEPSEVGSLVSGLVCSQARNAVECRLRGGNGTPLRYVPDYKPANQPTSPPPPARRAELREIAEICRRVPRQPARSFREAIQSVWLVHLAVRIDGTGLCIGRPDQFLYPYYRRDREAGRLTDAEALELLELYFIKLNEFGTWPQGCMVGGVDAAGRDATNELSYLCLQAMRNLRMVNPALAVDWYECTPDSLLRLGGQMLAEGVSHPAIFNGEVIVPGLVDGGLALEDARNHIHSTCIEMTPIGRSNIWVAHGYVNLAKALELALHNGVDPVSGQQVGGATGMPEDLRTFEDLKRAWRRQLAHLVAQNAEGRGRDRLTLAEHSGSPLISCFVHDCLERGRDIVAGGALYNNIYPQGVGLANVVDSLMALQKFVYDERQLTLTEVVEMCDRDFEGAETWRQRFLHQAPQYGNDLDEPDALAVEIAQVWYDEVQSHEAPLGGRFRPGFLCWIMHGVLGRETGALPDGRRARTALADSLGAAQGRARNGPTALLKSATKIDYRPANGGMVLNLKFSPAAIQGEDGVERLLQLLKTYLRRGGFEVQVNVISADTLREARAHPEEYPHLIVRVAGFSEYFTLLGPELQDEIIQRVEYEAV